MILARMERLLDMVGQVLPFYSSTKLLLLLVLVLSNDLSSILFDRVVRPSLKPYEGMLDFVGGCAGDGIDIALWVVLWVPKWMRRRWNGVGEVVSFWIIELRTLIVVDCARGRTRLHD